MYSACCPWLRLTALMAFRAKKSDEDPAVREIDCKCVFVFVTYQVNLARAL